MNSYICVFCDLSYSSSPYCMYLGKKICETCYKNFKIVSNMYEPRERGEQQEQQESPCIHCKECGKEFKESVSPYPNDNSEYCYMCYWRMLARGNERQDRYTCHECNQTFFTAEPNWFEGKRYCYTCFCKIKVKRDEERFESIFGKYRQQQYRSYTFNWDFVNDGATWRNTSSISSAIREAFTVLGLVPGATAQDIKKAFKQKALVTHPDLGGKHIDMVALNKAKEVALEYAGM